jgi:hypothetical protein
MSVSNPPKVEGPAVAPSPTRSGSAEQIARLKAVAASEPTPPTLSEPAPRPSATEIDRIVPPIVRELSRLNEAMGEIGRRLQESERRTVANLPCQEIGDRLAATSEDQVKLATTSLTVVAATDLRQMLEERAAPVMESLEGASREAVKLVEGMKALTGQLAASERERDAMFRASQVRNEEALQEIRRAVAELGRVQAQSERSQREEQARRDADTRDLQAAVGRIAEPIGIATLEMSRAAAWIRWTAAVVLALTVLIAGASFAPRMWGRPPTPVPAADSLESPEPSRPKASRSGSDGRPQSLGTRR